MKGEANNAYEIDNVAEPTSNPNEIDSHNKTEFQIENESLEKPESRATNKIKHGIVVALKFLIHVLVGAYFGYATYYHIDLTDSCNAADFSDPLCGWKFCSGYGLLMMLVIFVYFGLFYFLVFKPRFGKQLHKKYIGPFHDWWIQFSRTRIVSTVMIVIVLAALAIYLYFETRDEPSKLQSLVGPCFFILAGYVFSSNRKAIQWRTVITGIVIQFLLGVICIRWEVGRNIFECLGNKVADFLSFADDGSRFVFGDTLIQEGVFAFAILPVIFFFSFFISILYYLGAMQWVIIKLGWILQQMLGTTVCESVTAAANIFLGMSESPLLIRPYIKKLTASEIHSIMVSGFATVSGTVLAAYLSFGASPAHLITSSVMAAPASLAISKLYMPETEESQTKSDNIEMEKSEDSSILDAASSGATNAIPIVMGIIANIVAFIAFIAFLNAMVNWLGVLAGLEDIDFEWIFSKLFIPLAWAMGVPNEDCNIIAKVVATKTIINEFVAYERLGEYSKNGDITARSTGIATFAICGFANPSSLGILIGSLSAMAPQRRKLITSVAMRAFAVGSIVCFISASFAGILIQDNAMYETTFSGLERRNITIGFFKES